MVSRRYTSIGLLVCLMALLVPGASLAQTGTSLPVPPGRLLAGDDNGLFTMLADGSGKVYLAQDDGATCWLRDGSWSPDGEQIIYSAICGGSGPGDWQPTQEGSGVPERSAQVFLYDVEAEDTLELLPREGAFQDYAGDWFPDGDQVVLYSNRNDDDIYNLYTLDLASADLTQLSTFDGDASRVSVDPSGRYLLYNRSVVSGRQEVYEVRAFDLTTSSEIRVAPGVTPNWSPDGQWIAYATEGSESDIFLMPAACIFQGGECNPEADAFNLTLTPGIVEREPVFSPDQEQIVYVRDTDSIPETLTWDIFRQEIHTGLLQNLTNTPSTEERHREWEPVPNTNPADIAGLLPVIVRVATSEGAANLRDEPSTGGAIVGTVSNGQLLYVQSATANRSWYRITLPADGTQAWIFGNLIDAAQGDLESVPAEE